MLRLPRGATRFREANALRPPRRRLSQREGQMPRKSISGFAEAGAAMAQQPGDNDLLNLFSGVGRVVSERFLMKRPCLDRAVASSEPTSAIGGYEDINMISC